MHADHGMQDIFRDLHHTLCMITFLSTHLMILQYQKLKSKGKIFRKFIIKSNGISYSHIPPHNFLFHFHEYRNTNLSHKFYV